MLTCVKKSSDELPNFLEDEGGDYIFMMVVI